MKQTRRQRRRVSRKRGGGNANAIGAGAGLAEMKPPPITCDKEDGFTTEMMIASGGRNYDVGTIHEDGYSWTYEKRVNMAMNGIIQWYMNTLEKRKLVEPYTPSERAALRENPILQILGAFFLRYKVIDEQLERYLRLFSKGVKNIYPTVSDEFVGQHSYGKFLDALNSSAPPVELKASQKNIIKQALMTLKRYEDANIDESILILLNMIINRVHCLMFYIVKNKGMVPEGFVMDDRIRIRAERVLDDALYTYRSSTSGLGSFRNLRVLSNWIDLIFSDVLEFTKNPLTFGVF